MILEEKIVRITILISLFFGIFNLTGQFQTFLTPFIFNYTAVSLIALFFTYRNRNESAFFLLLLFSVGYVGITLFSGQFIYLINLFSSNKVLPFESEIANFLFYLLFLGSIILSLVKLIKINTKRPVNKYLIVQLLIFIVYVVFSGFLYSEYLFLAFSFLFSSNLLQNKIEISNGIKRILFLLFLNAVLEVMKIISLYFAQ